MRLVPASLVFVFLAACGSSGASPSGTLAITSSAFSANGAIPAKYTCDGADVSPPLSFGGVPEGAKSLVLIVDDPDAPDPAAPQMTWVHWVLYDLPPTTPGLDEAVSVLPAGTRAALSDFDKTGWGGPCPPVGKHRYFFKLYALDTVLGDLGATARKADVEKAMSSHVLAKGELIGTYRK